MSSPITANAYSVHGIAEMAPRPAKAADAARDVAAGESASAQSSNPMFGKDGFTFGDFLDIINPLQHIPIVSSVYRAMTGDKIDPGARLVGGGLFGGPIGLAASIVSGIVEESTGKDPGEHALAALGIDLGPTDKQTPQTMLAEAPQGAMPAPQAPFQGAPQDMKIGVTLDPARDAKPASAQLKADGPIELPADLFQALKQTAATQQADARSAAANGAMANPLPGQQGQARTTGPMQTNSAPGSVVRDAEGRSWFPAFPMGGGGVPTRAVGTSPVTSTAVTSKFGVTKGNNLGLSPQAAAASNAAILQDGDKQSEWANRASEAYQKYFEMQDQKNRRAGIVP